MPIDVLKAKWVDGAHVVYLGKGDNLQRRLKEYTRFGRGEKVGHWGGRYIWQLADSAELVVAWRKCDADVTPRSLEIELMQAFVVSYGRLPFANITN